MSISVSDSPLEVFHEDVFCYMASHFLGPNDLCHVASVCTIWEKFSKTPALWQSLFNREVSAGNLLAVEKELAPSEYHQAFRYLYSVCTVTPKMICETLGDVGPAPAVKPEIFDRLSQPCPIYPNKFQYETHELVLHYPSLERMVGEDTPLDLDKEGNLIEVAHPETKCLNIPLTLRNLAMLFRKYPLMNNFGQAWVYEEPDDIADYIYNDCAEKVSIYYQTKQIIITRENPALIKKVIPKEYPGWMAAGPLMFSTVVKILYWGKYPYIAADGKENWVRTSTTWTDAYGKCSQAALFPDRELEGFGGVSIHWAPSSEGKYPIGRILGIPAEASTSHS